MHSRPPASRSDWANLCFDLICSALLAFGLRTRFPVNLFSGTQHIGLQVIEDLVKKYKTVGGLLRKIEEVVTGTNNGKAPQLAGYYAYWEQSIFSALNNMVLNAMRMLVTMLHARSAKKAAAAGLPARPPLFKVSPEIRMCGYCM